MKQYSIDACANGKAITDCCEPCDTIFNGHVSSAETVTVPSGARYCLFDADHDIYVRFDGGTVYIPTGLLSAGHVHINPKAIRVSETATFSIMAHGNANVSLRFYK